MDYIPFVSSEESAILANKHYADAAAFRLSIDSYDKLLTHIPACEHLWIDGGVDGFDDLDGRIPIPSDNPFEPSKKNKWYERVKNYSGFDKIGNPNFWANPNQSIVDGFVRAVMDNCMKAEPSWITIPQLPTCQGSGRNKINKSLAVATASWKTKRKFAGKLILPIILTTQDHYNTGRTPRVNLAADCYQLAGASGFWIADSSLDEETCSGTLQKRIKSLISFHETLSEQTSSPLKIGGPYWGVNLVLWAKGLINHPAVSLGTTPRYALSGTILGGSNAILRLAVPSLRRRIKAGTVDYRNWLSQAIAAISPADPRSKDLQLQLQWLKAGTISVPEGREQIAKFYKDWIVDISKYSQQGRAMALFQDLATTYAFASALPPLPEGNGSVDARRPGAVAAYLMFHCL